MKSSKLVITVFLNMHAYTHESTNVYTCRHTHMHMYTIRWFDNGTLFTAETADGASLGWNFAQDFYNHTGWLGVKHQVTYLLGLKSLLYCFFRLWQKALIAMRKFPIRVCMHAHTFWNTVKHKHAYTDTHWTTHKALHTHIHEHTLWTTHRGIHTHTHKTQHVHMYMGK